MAFNFNSLLSQVVTTTYAPLTATVAGIPTITSYIGPAIPVVTPPSFTPAAKSVGDSLLAVLESDPDTQPFGALLSTIPDIFASLDARKEYIVFAPSPRSVLNFLANIPDFNPANPGDFLSLRRRQSEGEEGPEVKVPGHISILIAEKGEDTPDLNHVPATLKTALYSISAYANLGIFEGARIVSKPFKPEEGITKVVHGEGRETEVKRGELKFEKGVVKKCEDFFYIPTPIGLTLEKTEGKDFNSAMAKAKLLDDLTVKPRVSVFAIRDKDSKDKDSEEAELDEDTINGLIYDGLIYTPNMNDGKCIAMRNGATIQFKAPNGAMGDITVNGVKIIKSNVISTNGVVHYLEKVPPKVECVPEPAENFVPQDGGEAAAKDKGKESKASYEKSPGVLVVFLTTLCLLSHFGFIFV